MGHSPRHLSVGLLVALLFHLVPARADQCLVGCHGMKAGKDYITGHTYSYDFEGISVTSVSGAEGDSTVKLNALVELAVKPDCIHQLKLKNVRVNGAPVAQDDVEKYALQYNYHDGHIDTNICAEKDDSQASLNIKRAIVSLFQSAVFEDNGITTHYETDIFGTCPTEFEFHREGDNLTVRKSRNLARCSHRESMKHGLIHAIYDDSSEIKSSPILNSHQQINQIFTKGILNNAKSTETYYYRPFANGDAGAKTIVQSSVTFKSEKAVSANAAPVELSKSLVFDPPHPVTESSSAEAIVNALKAVKDQSGVDAVKDEAAEKFGYLVKILKRSNKFDIQNVYRKVKSGANGFDKNSDKKILLDALYRTGSGDAAEVITALIKNKEVIGMQALAFYASLALMNHATLSSVTAVTSLLDQPNLPRIGYLGIGRVIGKYCQQHKCEGVPEISAAITKIFEKVGNGKSASREQENIAIAALKAIHNAGYINDEIIKNIVAIANDKTVSNRVRVAAVESLAAKCSMEWKTPIIKLFGDQEEDSEIRIKAYLSLVECSCPHVANAIKKIIDVENINQVGSFVTSHLRNLRATTDPSKQYMKNQLGEVKPIRKFPEDFRKFSFNNEFSYNIDSLGIGSSIEQNVIYSQKSFVPRSVSLNLTTELFGRSFNFLEIDARAENLDRLIEHYFGPKGILKRQGISALLMNSKEGASDVFDHVKERVEKTRRGRRSTIKQADLDIFAKSIKSKSPEVDDDLDIDLSLRLFGVELAYVDLRESSTGNSNPNLAVDRIFDFIDRSFKQMKAFDYNVAKHIHFIDVDLIYPTGLGFPLSVGVEGNGVVHIKANGKLDVPAIMNDPNNAAIKIGLEPSANIAIIASLTVETFGIESGLKVISRLHTATGSDLSILVLDGKGIDINLGIPKKKQEIISVSSQVLLINGKDNVREPKFPKGKERSDCFDQFSTALGITVCGHFAYPYNSIESAQKTPIFPLSGPSKFAITIENNDATSFHFRTYYDTSIENQRSLEATFDTPNSRTNRKVALRIEGVNKPTEKYIKATFNSPLKNIDGKILLENTEQKKAITISLDHDKDEYLGSIGLVANGNKYKPILEYKVPDHIEKLSGKGTKGGSKPIYKIDGDIAVNDQDGGKKYTFDKVTLVASGKKLASVDGYVVAKPDGVVVDTKVSHNDESLTVKFDGKKSQSGFDINASLIPSKDPTIGFKTIWHYDLSNNLIDHSFIFIYGPDLESKNNRLTITDRLSYKKHDHPNNPYEYFSALNCKSEITWPAQELTASSEIELSLNSFETEFDIKYGKFKIGSEFEVKTEENMPHNWEFGFGGYILDNKFLLAAKHQKMSDFKRKFEGKLELPGGKYETELIGNYQVDGHNADVKFNGILKINGKNLKLDYGLDANPEKIDSHALINFENVKYLDFILKLQRGNVNPHGNLNLNLKNFLFIIGQFDYQQGKGTGNIVIELPKFERKIKATGDISVTGKRHVANIDILLNAEKDPSKIIKLSTDSEIDHGTIDSKNIIELFSYKTEFNVKGQYKDKKQDGYDIAGSADVTLPSGQYIVAKGKQSVDHKPDKTEIHSDYEVIEHPKKGGQSRSIAYKGDVSFSEPKRSEFDGKYTLKLVNLDGRDIQLLVTSNHAKINPEKYKSDVHISATGGYLPKPFALDLSADYTNKHDVTIPHESSWDFKSSFGNDFSVKGKGKYSDGTHINKPRDVDFDIVVVLPFEKLRNIKYQGATQAKLPYHDGDEFDYEGSYRLTYNDDKKIEIDAVLRQSGFQPEKKKDGSFKVKLGVLAYPPLTVETSFVHDPTGELNKGSAKLNVNYGDKAMSADIDGTYLPNLNNVAANIKATLPSEKLRNIEFGFVHNYEETGIRKYNAHLVADEKKYEWISEFEINPSIHRTNIVFNCPTGKTELLAKVEKLSDTEYKAEWKIDSPKGFVVSDGHVKMDNIDNFVIQINFDSDKIQHRKIHAEITTTPAVKTGKRIILTVTSDGKNIVTGSTSYSKRDEAGQVIVEGSGSLKIGETGTRSSKFTYSRKQLIRENDGETGVAMLLNANFGPSAVVGELKLSDKEVLVFNSYCEQSKDCAHFKLQGTVNTDHNNHLDHQIIVEVDLKKFNIPVEFGLKSTTHYHPKELTFDHGANLYLHTSKDKTQYSSEIYVHPKESAIILTLPSRELALIAAVDVPKTKTPIGPFKIDISVYLDRKNRPNEKTSFIASGDLNIEKNSADISGEARFIYPSQLTKDMVVKSKVHYEGDHLLDVNLDIDVFAKKAQKIVINARMMKNIITKGYNITSDLDIISPGQQLKVSLKENLVLSASKIGFGSMLSYTDEHQKPKSIGVIFALDPRQAHLLVKGPDRELIKSDTSVELINNAQKINTEFVLLNNPPIIINIETHDMNSFKYQSYQKDKPDTKLVVTGRAVIGQVADIHADAYKNGEKKNLFSIGIYLDESRFFKPNFSYNKDNLGAMIDFYRNRIAQFTAQLKEAVKDIGTEAVTEFKDLFEHLKKSQPNWKPIIQYYQNELEKLKQELNADTTIKEIQATLNKVFGGLISAVTKILGQFTERMAELNRQYHEITEKIVEAMKATYPRIQESIDKILQAGVEIVDAASKLIATYLKTILHIINEHQKEIKELIGAITELTNDIVKIIARGYNEVENEIKSIIKLITQQIQTVPIYEFIKEKYAAFLNYQIPDAILIPIEEAFTQFRTILPTVELREFFTVTYNYILKHIKRQKVDDSVEIKNIYAHAIDAIQSIIQLLQSHGTADQFYSLFGTKLQSDFGYLKNLPGIPILRVSIINILKNRELPSIVDIYYAYRPTLYPSDIIPPFSKSGIVVEGGHFFTFDGRHLTMAGTCDYVLSQDTRDGNFSIVGSFNAGKLISITVTAPGESITLKSNGNILVDNKPADYPASTKNLHAFLTLPIVNVKSDYGLHIACTQKAPMICSVHVSGFYHGKLRGIFGDANNEPYDDFNLPSGHLAETESEFGNAYKLHPGCAVSPQVDHHNHGRNPTCTEYFSGNSVMSPCFKYVNPIIYRQGCDHATSAGTPHAACLISTAYLASCFKERVFITVPPACASCKVGKDEIAIGDSFSVKIPKKEADIVFVVEQETKNEKIFKELITQLIAEVKNELSQHGITDVHIGLIGYGEHLKWPQHYTVNGNLNIDGPVKNIEFAPNNPPISLNEAKEGDFKMRAKYVGQRLDVELGRFKLTDAYEEAVRYPFRVGAAKAVIGVIASPCEKSPLPISLQHLRLFMGLKAYRDLGLTYYNVGYLNDIMVSGKPQKNVVGYDAESGYTFSDSKKKPLEGSIDKNNLVLANNDVCASFAVSSGGAVFSSEHFLDGKPNQKKQFIQIMARRLATGLTNTEIDEDCTCTQNYWVDGHTKCKIIARKEKEPLAKHTKGGVKG